MSTKDLYSRALRLARTKPESNGQTAALLQKAHQEGDARATYALATWYLHGKYYQRDLPQAISLLKMAAKAGHAEATYDLAVCYETGEGTKRNAKKAAQLYLRASLLGEVQSHFEMGRCFYHGIGVAIDRGLSRIWRQRAWELGVRD